MPAPGDLLDVQNATDPETISQQNAETLARMLWKREPTYISGVPNTVVGPPTSGARVVNELWIDKHLAVWLCTAAGTPGTWVQFGEAWVTQTSDVSSPPTNYTIFERSNHAFKYWNGSSWVTI